MISHLRPLGNPAKRIPCDVNGCLLIASLILFSFVASLALTSAPWVQCGNISPDQSLDFFGIEEETLSPSCILPFAISTPFMLAVHEFVSLVAHDTVKGFFLSLEMLCTTLLRC